MLSREGTLACAARKAKERRGAGLSSPFFVPAVSLRERQAARAAYTAPEPACSPPPLSPASPAFSPLQLVTPVQLARLTLSSWPRYPNIPRIAAVLSEGVEP